eukprot:GHVH01004617.1.p1 GENE.GHVH01004617.1~~GHVH01004617.1.p1  ORF type:complete len:170 (+),score=28.23 GHVH01004617.1:73-582(+)
MCCTMVYKLFINILMLFITVSSGEVFNADGERNPDSLHDRLAVLEKAVMRIEKSLNDQNFKSNGSDGSLGGVESEIAQLSNRVQNLARDEKLDQRENRIEIGALSDIKKELKTEQEETSAVIFILMALILAGSAVVYQYRKNLLSGDVYAKYAARRSANVNNANPTFGV